jgi:hypothetical protein
MSQIARKPSFFLPDSSGYTMVEPWIASSSVRVGGVLVQPSQTPVIIVTGPETFACQH